MRRSARILVVGVAAAAAVASAQPGPRTGPPGGPGRRWDPKTVETVSGQVVRVDRVAAAPGSAAGVHAVLRPDAGGTLDVRLGPAWYLDRQDVKIAADDRVQVKGSRVEIDGKPALIAAEVKKGDRALVLRDAAGVPAWSRGRRRGPRP